MVAVQEIDLAPHGVRLPNARVGMVLLQPYLQLTAVEPYEVQEAAKQQQLASIRKTLRIARLADHGEEKTHFTLFPELSIPGQEGIALIDDAMGSGDWAPSSFVIGGIHGLTKAEYGAICNAPRTIVHPANAPEAVQDAQWVNCFITWMKAANGEVFKWVQPKICPAWAEQDIMHQHMFRGRAAYLFKCRFENGTVSRFLSLICFDWIGRGSDGAEIVPQILESISGLGGGENIALHWLFVLQCNDSPNHATFLNRVNQVLVQQGLGPAARRENACLVLCNISDRNVPGRSAQFGRTSLIFAPQAPFVVKQSCRPSYCGKSEIARGVGTIKNCKDAVLRENGACVHSLSQNISAFMAPDAAGKSSSLEVVNVHPWLDDGLPDARTPGGPVPCSVKWTNDELDGVRLLEHPEAGSEVATQYLPTHQNNIQALRVLRSQKLQETVEIASPPEPGAYLDADYWGNRQAEALETTLDTFDIVRLAYGALDIGASDGQATFALGGRKIDLVAVRGQRHETCAHHVRTNVVPRMRHQLLIVSRDRENLPLLSKYKRIYDVPKQDLGEPKITEAGEMHIAFIDVLNSFMVAQTQQQLEVALSAKLGA